MEKEMDIRYSAVKAPIRGRIHHQIHVGRALIYGFMFLLLAVSLIPLIWVIRTAFIPKELTLDLTAVAWPTLENFRRVLDAAPFGKYYGNTIFIVVGVLLVQFVLITLAGYAFARIDFYGSKALFVLFLFHDGKMGTDGYEDWHYAAILCFGHGNADRKADNQDDSL